MRHASAKAHSHIQDRCCCVYIESMIAGLHMNEIFGMHSNKPAFRRELHDAFDGMWGALKYSSTSAMATQDHGLKLKELLHQASAVSLLSQDTGLTPSYLNNGHA